MYQLTKVGTASNVPVKEYVCETEDDVRALPNDPLGSSAFCIENKSVYMKSGDNTSGDLKNGWIKL